jgi:hypothetical protein
VGHAVTGALMGGGSREAAEHEAASPQQQQQPMYAGQQQQLEGGPCQLQMKQFLECAQTQTDITLCQGFNEALRECKLSYGMSN